MNTPGSAVKPARRGAEAAGPDLRTQSRGGGVLPTDPRYGEILQFLYDEAEVLDEGRYGDWLELLTEDVLYRMPIRLNRRRRSEAPTHSDDTEIFSDNLASLRVRADRLTTNFAWAEDPPSRTRHFVTNVRVRTTDRPDELEVRSNVLVYRNRLDKPVADLYSGERQDRVRRIGEAWRLASRTILLDQAVVGASNVSFLL